MAQILDPDSDLGLNGWTDPGNGTTNIWQNIADGSDASYIRSSASPDGTNDHYTCGLTPADDPASPGSGDCVLQIRHRKSGGKSAALSVQLQNNASTLREAIGGIVPTTSFVTDAYNTLDSSNWLTGELADARCQMVPSTSGGGSPTNI